MSAEEGNSYWRRRLVNKGKPRKFETAEELAEACVEYLEWVEDNPLFEDKPMSSRDGITHETITKMRVPTIQGLTTHLGVHRITWNKWRESRDDLKETIALIDNAMEAVQLEGASAGLLNASIIARMVGLVDKVESKSVTADLSELPREEIENKLKEIFSD